MEAGIFKLISHTDNSDGPTVDQELPITTHKFYKQKRETGIAL